MTGLSQMRPLAILFLFTLAACGGGPRGDWRADVGRTTPNPVVLVPAEPLMVPPVLDLPAPGGANRATPGR